MKSRYLILSAHTDDAEIAMGGTIAKLVDNKEYVAHIALSTVPIGSLSTSTVKYKKEFFAASEILGINDYAVYDFPMREFPAHRQAILDALINIKGKYVPTHVFCPTLRDTHQDHEVLAREVFRAFKNCSILGYELPWNNITFDARCYSEITESQLQRKINATSVYVSQSSIYPYFDTEYIRSLARARGGHVGVRFSEVFEVVRWHI